jgi:hypothetical protein
VVILVLLAFTLLLLENNQNLLKHGF